MSHEPESPRTPEVPEPDAEAGTRAQPDPMRPDERWLRETMRGILTSNWLVTLLAIVAALVLSGLLIAIADEDVRDASTYFFARPLDTLAAAWDSVAAAYTSLFRGAVFDFQAPTLARAIRPITETLVAATPLIFAALGLGMGFRSGLFNIGAQGQVLMGAAAATYVGITWSLPVVVHVVLAVIAAMVVGGLWAGIAGFLKARTGASEVIVTIMLNWIAIWLVTYLLTTTILRQGGSRPISPAVGENARLPLLFGDAFRLHWGFLLALAAAALVWWLMERSTIGFKFRAVGANMDAARTAGINVNLIFVFVMVSAGILAGLGGASQILGTDKTLQAGSAGSIGFDAITVALLGRSRPLGTVLAALLFGALRAGSPLMQTVSNTPIDIVLVIQAVIVLFIAAPPLVRSMFFLPSPDGSRRVKEVAA
ncbi:ABC transporter permease [Occultella aeris]|uniref:Ribose transport system permease protein RbsC n=1 Tax=Occultella aeris TaxID=2761496 RepID=A0A7M4DLS7_9MICO|nr:ABC transporter permease [Occultella aeris]VZO38255.1 Ribose transport system permease protein RbsC [Occultella aeris]